jgi:hypothetical protein
VTALTEPEIDIGRVGEGHLVALAVSGALDADAYYRCPYDGGAVFVAVELPDGPAVLEGSPAARTLRVVQAAIGSLPPLVSRRSVEAYPTRLGAKTVSDPGRITRRRRGRVHVRRSRPPDRHRGLKGSQPRASMKTAPPARASGAVPLSDG